MKKLYLQNIVLITILCIFVVCYLLFFGRFNPAVPSENHGIVHGHQSKTFQETKSLRSKKREIIHLFLQKADFDGNHIKEVLHRIMGQHIRVHTHSLPISQESIDWMMRLPYDHAVSMLQILNHTHPVDWQEQVVSLRNLSIHEQKRALKINRYNSNSFECFDKESCHG